MTFQPAHKVVGDAHKPGQTINTTKEYIDKVMREERKLSFADWYVQNEIYTYDKTEHECMEMAWNASRENM